MFQVLPKITKLLTILKIASFAFEIKSKQFSATRIRILEGGATVQIHILFSSVFIFSQSVKQNSKEIDH